MKKINRIVYSVAAVAAMSLSGCYEVEDFYSVPENIETPDAIFIESNCAKFTPLEVDEKVGRLRYRISTSPDFPEDLTEVEWEPYFSGLTSNTRYYYQVVLYNKCDVYDIDEHAIYGEVKSFVTSPVISDNYNKASLFASSEKATPLEFTYMMEGNAATFVEGGFCFDTDPEKLTKDKCAVVKKGDYSERNNKVGIDNFFDSKLPQGAIIYVRPYLTTTGGTYYGKESYVVMVSGFVGDKPYIDLGLPSGTKWFVLYSGYNEPIRNKCSNYNYYYYSELSELGIPDGCRIPNLADAKELADNCTSEYKNIYGYCIEVKGPNNNIIYFPLRGYYDKFDRKITKMHTSGYIYLDGAVGGYQRVYAFGSNNGLLGYDCKVSRIHAYNVRFVKN